MAKLSNITTVLFDLGDTLLYFDGNWNDVFAQARQELLRSLQRGGVSVDQAFLDNFYARMQAYYRERETEFIEHTISYVLTTALEEHGLPPLPPDQIAAALADMHTITQAHWLPEEDALPTLQRLKEQGYRMALISNAADDPNTQFLVDKGGFRPYFEVIVSSAAHGLRKPNPRIFHDVLEQMGVLPQQAVMVGDTLGADILGAHNAGMAGIWITRRADKPGNRDHLDTIRPDAVIERLADLPELLRQ